ncbi:MAG: acyl-CoA thioesterase [Anaerolineae bacterium]|nr:acyl-CoA thioesterase [Anaerolineae bacterium]
MIDERPLEKQLESTVVIRFQDCDPFQHLNNARYIDYFMNAREDHLKHYYDFRIFDVFEQTGHAWVVTKNQIAYLAPAVMLEAVVIQTQLIQMTENILVVEGLMLDKARQRLKSVAWIEFAFVSLLNGKPAKHPDEFMDRFQPVRVDGIFDPDGFSARVNALKSAYRRQAAS